MYLTANIIDPHFMYKKHLLNENFADLIKYVHMKKTVLDVFEIVGYD